MEDTFDLNRFIEKQDLHFPQALMEIKSGEKEGHWMWYIFPQCKGLGRSARSHKYAIKSSEEAQAYFEHPILRARLIEIAQAFLELENRTALEVLASPDHIKMKSCMTLFNKIQTEAVVFSEVLDKYFGGLKCNRTVDFLQTH